MTGYVLLITNLFIGNCYHCSSETCCSTVRPRKRGNLFLIMDLYKLYWRIFLMKLSNCCLNPELVSTSCNLLLLVRLLLDGVWRIVRYVSIPLATYQLCWCLALFVQMAGICAYCTAFKCIQSLYQQQQKRCYVYIFRPNVIFMPSATA